MRRLLAGGWWHRSTTLAPVDWAADLRFSWLWDPQPRHVRVLLVDRSRS